MRDWLRRRLLRRAHLSRLRAEHARIVAHRLALVRIADGDPGRRHSLALGLLQTDLQLAAVEQEIRSWGAEPPAAPETSRIARLP